MMSVPRIEIAHSNIPEKAPPMYVYSENYGRENGFVSLQKQFRSLRPPAGRQYRMPISQQPFNRTLPNFQQLLLMSNEGKVENFSSFAYG